MPNKPHNQYQMTSSEFWTKQVWKGAEAKWIARDGQDSYYRNKVAIPGLINNIIQLYEPGPIDLIDVGCGDGYLTDSLVVNIASRGLQPINIFLLDQSRKQLSIAVKRSHLNKAIKIDCNLLDSDWSTRIPISNRRRLIMSVFVVQELPSLQPFLTGLSRIMKSKDVSIFLTVAPSYSASLARRSIIRSIVKGDQYDDWQWRGLYPIDSDAGIFYLPHFQRTTAYYKWQFSRHGIQCVHIDYRALPVDEGAISLFSKTIYGKGIVGTKSSLILVFKKHNS
jgi:ubiquinone/menaquinone biosynthesis C-methylase UbiE